MSNIAAIANRLQDRADQLSQERSNLHSLQTKLSTIQHHLSKEETKQEQIRQDLLTQTRIAHDHELETFKYKRLIRNLQLQNKTHLNDTKKYKHETQSLRKEYDAMNQNLFVPHQFETSIYKRQLEHRVQSLKAKRRKREETMDRLVLETERNREEVLAMEREGRRKKDEIKMMEEIEAREDEEIAAVAMQIRATLAKVCTCF